MSLLRELQRGGVLRPLDEALVDALRRLQPDTPDEVLAAAALASLAVAQGHAAFDPARPQPFVDGALPWPDAQDWLRQLAQSPLVARPESPEAEAQAAPLALEHGLLYLRRYREYERRLAVQLRRIAAVPVEQAGLDAIAPLFAILFPPVDAAAMTAAAQGDDHQARAAALALRRNLLLVTGGPGTGKTTTIARLLVLRIALTMQAGRDPPRIALAAPTGRAAERMAESLQRATAAMRALGVDEALLAGLPASASTLHRLLGTIPDSPVFRHGADNPLPCDIVVVDEASMVDLPLMCKLAEAVADGTQLVLLGDADQLPSVEAGDVLAAILRAAGAGDALAREDADALRGLVGDVKVDADANGLRGHRVHLQRGWRQSDSLQLAPLAEAVRAGDAAEALRLLRGGQLANVQFHEGVDDPLRAHPQLLEHFRALAQETDPVRALARANRVRLLTALRNGAQGARGLNARIEAALSGQRLGSPPAWFPGRLLLVTENSYRHGLFNGDVGICLRDDKDVPLAWFAGNGGLRAFHLPALPAHDSAFAMTVHKAQGSEFDEVWLQLPDGDSRVLSRELVYTGLTRARIALHVAGSAEVMAAALARHAARVSGLGWRLGSAG